MFKSALSSLSSSVTGAAKATIQSYKPTPENLHGSFNRIAEQGIANLSYRSPIMADIAQTMLQSFQFEIAKKDQISKYVKSDKSADLRGEVTAQMGSKATSKEIDAEMVKVISKISKSIDEVGQAQTMESELFKKYGKHFDDFKKETTKQTQAEEPQVAGGLSEAHLIRIENNTLRTVDVLEGMTQHGVGGNHSGTSLGTEPSAPQAGGASFIDPYTGMPSVKAAIGSIGGSFLAKVFDDDLLEKYASKVKSYITPADKEDSPIDTPEAAKEESTKPTVKKTKRDDVPQSIKDIVGNLDLNLDSPIDTPEAAKEESTKTEHRANVHIKLVESTVQELKKLNDNVLGLSTKSDSEKGGLVDKLKDMAEGRIGKGAMSLAARAAPVLGGAAAVGAAGVAGYQFGKHVVNPLINSGISAMTGKETSLGSWIYDKMNPDQIDPNAAIPIDPARVAAAKARIEAAKNTQAAQVEAATNKAQKAAATPAAPIVIAPSQTIENGGPSGNTVIAVSSVRNQDSTFERVQMQDFWNRTA